MFEVLAIMIVLWIKGCFVRGSTNAGNSVSTSVISLPLSPQPMYTTICASAHLASVCSETVFPVPNPPGIMAVPPFVTGKMLSNTRCPVSKGKVGSSFCAYGLPILTGHFCISVILVPLSKTHTVSSTAYVPLSISSIVPEIWGGTMILCVM